jgi:hypothetical protein
MKQIIGLLDGRIGNCMFETANAYSFALDNDAECLMMSNYHIQPSPDNCTLEKYLTTFNKNIMRNVKYTNINQYIADYEILNRKHVCKTDIKNVYIFGDITMYIEDDFNYNKIPFVNDKMYLRGYFQSDKYFINHKKEIFDLFSIDNLTKNQIENEYGELLKNGAISIHVRRGDYLKLQHLFNVLPYEYYEKIINYFGKNKTYLIFSDDMKWCKENFKGDNFHFIDSNNPVIDLYTQTLCEHNIISCSTFSWWGAYLNQNIDKKVFIPYPWFNKGYRGDTTDIYPENWIKNYIK